MRKSRTTPRIVTVLIAGSALWVGTAACSRSDAPGGSAIAPPAEHVAGRALFEAHCARCHGPGGTGSDRGPSLLSKIYEPSHHADASFVLAVQRGVRPHHWQFGPMPPIPGLSDDEVARLIGYIRWAQREAGIS